MVKIQINNKTRIIRKIRFQDDKHLEAEYHGWQISIFPMYGKIVAGRYCDTITTGKFGVNVAGSDGCRIVDDVQPSMRKAIEEALLNILLCSTQYER